MEKQVNNNADCIEKENDNAKCANCWCCFLKLVTGYREANSPPVLQNYHYYQFTLGKTLNIGCCKILFFFFFNVTFNTFSSMFSARAGVDEHQ